jgi:hypothetical protein
MIQTNTLTAVTTGSLTASLALEILRWGGGEENNKAKMSTMNRMRNQATPKNTGPKGTTQNWAAMPAAKSTRKRMTSGITEFWPLYGENKMATIRAMIKAPKIPMFLFFE